MKRLLHVVLLIAGAALVPVAPAQAAACSGSSGVTVVVDFDNGDVQVRCTSVGPGDTGYDVLRAAGFHLENVQDGRNGAALCSIDHVPDHTCTSMPSASSYWAYFHAKRGGVWGYSTEGGGSYQPKPGSVEGWHYRGSPSNPPGISPPGSPSPSKPTSDPTPRPTSAAHPTAVPTAAHSRAGASDRVQAPGGTAATTTSGSSSPTTTRTPEAGSVATPTDGATTATTATAGDGSAVEAPRSTDPADSSGNHSWIWGVVLVLALAAAAGTTAIRRRRA